MKVLVLGYGSYASMFEEHNDVTCMPTSVKNMENAVQGKPLLPYSEYGLVVFCGGTDVNPRLYGAIPHPRTQSPDLVRDANEMYVFRQCYENSVPMFGICRGSQFLNVANGGTLVQDINNHGIFGTHKLFTRTSSNKEFKDEGISITSTHHQMMFPGCTSTVLAVAHEATKYSSTCPRHGDAEIVWYPGTNSLCIQGHPEYMPRDSAGFLYTKALLKDKFDVDIS